jgi:arylsulfatase
MLLAPLAVVYAADQGKPNIILVMPDDSGYGDYAYLGNPVTRTLVVDARKEEGLLFTQFHVSPICSPCRSALMSGRHERNGAENK